MGTERDAMAKARTMRAMDSSFMLRWTSIVKMELPTMMHTCARAYRSSRGRGGG
jgi:hypothetical protein